MNSYKQKKLDAYDKLFGEKHHKICEGKKCECHKEVKNFISNLIDETEKEAYARGQKNPEITVAAAFGFEAGYNHAQSEMREDLIKNAKPEIQEILWDYSNWLHKHGYLDTDYYTEEPHAVDEYLNNLNKSK